MGTVTRPVTQVAVVAVKSASIYGIELPSAQLTGNAKRILPIIMVSKKLNIIICVEDSEKRFFPILFTSQINYNKIISQCIPDFHTFIINLDKKEKKWYIIFNN